jgi:hypothetical protein
MTPSRITSVAFSSARPGETTMRAFVKAWTRGGFSCSPSTGVVCAIASSGSSGSRSSEARITGMRDLIGTS